MHTPQPPPTAPSGDAAERAHDPVHGLLTRVGVALDRDALLAPEACCLVAVSGGLDSSVLLDVLAALAPTRALRLTVGHVDHSLRDDSADDARQAAAHAARLGLPFRALRVDVPRRADGGASEESAREARLAALAALATESGAATIALAHTADDQAETLLLRLGRGVGPGGLSGMAPARTLPSGLRLVRPLLGEPRSALRAYAKARGLAWVEDPTNATDCYLRNRVRHTLLPVLETLFGAGVTARLAGLASTAREDADALAWTFAALEGALWQSGGPGTLRVDAARLAAMPHAARRHLLREALHVLGIRTGVYRVHLDRIAALADTARGSVVLHLPRGVTVERRYRELLVRTGGAAGTSDAPRARTIDGPGRVECGAYALELRIVPALAGPPSTGLDEAWFDASEWPFPLRLRAPRAGERIRPLGMEGHRKMSRILVDRKVPRTARAGLLVLADRDDRPLWLAGVVRSAERLVIPGRGPVLHVRQTDVASREAPHSH